MSGDGSSESPIGDIVTRVTDRARRARDIAFSAARRAAGMLNEEQEEIVRGYYHQLYDLFLTGMRENPEERAIHRIQMCNDMLKNTHLTRGNTFNPDKISLESEGGLSRGEAFRQALIYIQKQGRISPNFAPAISPNFALAYAAEALADFQGLKPFVEVEAGSGVFRMSFMDKDDYLACVAKESHNRGLIPLAG